MFNLSDTSKYNARKWAYKVKCEKCKRLVSYEEPIRDMLWNYCLVCGHSTFQDTEYTVTVRNGSKQYTPIAREYQVIQQLLHMAYLEQYTRIPPELLMRVGIGQAGVSTIQMGYQNLIGLCKPQTLRDSIRTMGRWISCSPRDKEVQRRSQIALSMPLMAAPGLIGGWWLINARGEESMIRIRQWPADQVILHTPLYASTVVLYESLNEGAAATSIWMTRGPEEPSQVILAKPRIIPPSTSRVLQLPLAQ